MGLSIFSIAVKNILRRPMRAAVIFIGVAAMSGTLFALTVIYMSVANSMEKGRSRLGADAAVVPSKWKQETADILLSGAPSEFYMKADVEEKLKKFKGVSRTTAQLFIVSAPFSCCSVADTMLVGFEPEDDFTISPWLRGEGLKGKLSDNEVIAGWNILVETGGRLRFYEKEFTVAGKLEPTGMRFIDSSVFIPMNGARRMIEESSENQLRPLGIGRDEISAVLLRFEEGVSHEKAAVEMEYSFPELKVILASDVLRKAAHNLAVPMKAVIAASVLQWLISIFMIGVVYWLSIGEREKEMGILRAMGARQTDVRRIFLYEILMLSGAGGSAGIFCGLAFILVFGNLIRVFFNVPFLLPPAVQIIAAASAVLLLSVASGMAATLYPALRLSAKSPFDIIRQAS